MSLYLGTNATLMPVGMQNVIEASSLVVLVVPVLVLFLAQRPFMQGLVITGTEK